MKFNSAEIAGVLVNDADFVGRSLRAIGNDRKVVISQGYGMTEKGLPLRALAYLVPVLRLLKLLPANVTAEIYFAKAGVLRANGSAAAAIESNFQLLESLMRFYISRAHGNLNGRIRILWDSDPEPCVDRLIDDLVIRSTSMIEDEDAIKRFLEKRGDKALRYMAEHVIYMRDPIDFGMDPKKVKLVPDMRMDMDYVIMIGGPAEKVFYRFRNKLVSQSTPHNLWKSLQFFTCIGNTPTYHLKDSETAWQDKHLLPAEVAAALRQMVENIASDYGAKKDIIRDMVYLLLDAGGSAQFTIGGAAKLLMANGRLPEGFLQCLQAGWNLIRTL